eukprot:scaffold115657_cov28-Tisochrysis_lutea.AAC.1
MDEESPEPADSARDVRMLVEHVGEPLDHTVERRRLADGGRHRLDRREQRITPVSKDEGARGWVGGTLVEREAERASRRSAMDLKEHRVLLESKRGEDRQLACGSGCGVETRQLGVQRH